MNKKWKPKIWISILLGIFLHAFAFLYLNKPKIFWFYLVSTVIVSILDWYFQTFFNLVFSILCPVHAYFVAKNYNPGRPRKWYSRWWGIPVIYIFIFSTVFLFRSFLYEPFYIPAASMSPNLDVGDHIIVKKYGYGGYGTFGVELFESNISRNVDMKRGKVYAFHPPTNLNTIFTKRLIAKPGDTIEIKGSRILVNGLNLRSRKLFEDSDFIHYEEISGESTYIVKRSKNRPFPGNMELTTIPDNHYFFLGDNRDNSSDSRIWGTVSSQTFVGEVASVFKKTSTELSK